MAYQLRHGTVKGKKTRSSANKAQRITFSALIIILVFSITSCSNDYIALSDIPQPALSVVGALPASVLPVVVSASTSMETSRGVKPLPMVDPATVSEFQADVPVCETGCAPKPEIDGEKPLIPQDLLVNLSSENAIVQPSYTSVPPVMYYTQAGDTLSAVATRFDAQPSEIVSATLLNQSGFLDPNLLLLIPPVNMQTASNQKLMPDSELIYSPSAIDFDINAFVVNAGGYLATYRQYLNSSGWLSGAGIIRKVAIDNSINPRLLLSLLQYQSNWVYGQPANQTAIDYPMGHVEEYKKGLHAQLTWAVTQMSYSYYAWREGTLTTISFKDGSNLRAAPEINAGTFALEYLFAQMYDQDSFDASLFAASGFPAMHVSMFGDPWLKAVVYEPIFPSILAQPDLILPIEPGVEWAYTGGPHSAWGKLGARAALDFAPSGAGGCSKSDEWVLAAASGVVARSGGGVVVLDLDGDGNEQTGWNLFYMHIATEDRPVVGQWLDQGERLGHPSCEGGVSTGTHFHFARKYNGEWILAGGPLPFDMDGWIAHAAEKEYKGTLTRDDNTVNACTCATADTYIFRDEPGQE